MCRYAAHSHIASNKCAKSWQTPAPIESDQPTVRIGLDLGLGSLGIPCESKRQHGWSPRVNVMDVRIEHCTVCWGYRARALELADVLRKRFGASVEVAGGTLGQFDVHVDGRLISSRGNSLLARAKPPRLPDIAEIVAAIESQEALSKGTVLLPGSKEHKFGPEDAKRFYDWFGAWQDAQFYEKAAIEFLIAQADFEHASTVFEWGCGTGRLAKRLFERHLARGARYVGIDISTTMARIATRRLAHWSGRAMVQQADGTEKLQYADLAFDRFIAAYVFDLLPEPAIHFVLGEAHRLLRSNGKLCVASSTEGATVSSRVLSFIWNSLYAFNPRYVGGCRPLRVSTLLGASWRLELVQVVCSWGICSEVVIASPI